MRRFLTAGFAFMLLGVLSGCAQSPHSTVQTAPTVSPSSARAKLQPASKPQPRIILGMFTKIPGLTPAQGIAEREAELHRTISIHHSFYNWTDWFPASNEVDDVQHGRTPLITWWGWRYSEIIDGSQDQVIRARADAIRAFGHHIYLAWAAEMNLQNPPWPNVGQGPDPAGFVASWRHIHKIFDEEGVTNVTWVWTPNAESDPGGTDPNSPNNWKHYYPGDDVVDWVGIDGYNWGGLGWQTFAAYVNPIYQDYANRKPIMLVETASSEIGGDKAQWIQNARSWMLSHSDIRGFVWFDQRSTALHDWRIDSSPAAMAAFRELASDPVFSK